MAYKLSVTELAYEDLSNIISYMAFELSNKPAVVHFIGKLKNATAGLRKIRSYTKNAAIRV